MYTLSPLVYVLATVVVVTCFAAGWGVLKVMGPSQMNRFIGFVSVQGQRLETRRFYLPFYFACFLVALILGLYVTQSGPGISPDSTDYISSATGLHAGDGFGSFPTAQRAGAPLYPLTITALMYLGLGAEQAAGLVPILSFALLMFPLFFLGKTTGGVLTGYAVCLVSLLFAPLLWLASWAWTEMLYVLLSVSAILFLVKYAKSDEAKTKLLCVAALFTILALLTRYIGVTLVLVGLMTILVKNKSHLRKTAYQMLLFGSMCFLPYLIALLRDPSFVSWLTSVPGTHSWASLAEAVGSTAQMLDDPRIIAILTILGTFLVLSAVYMKVYTPDRRGLVGYLKSNHVVITYIFVYLIACIAMKATLYDAPRYMSPVSPFVILAIISFVIYAFRQISRRRLKPNWLFVAAVLWVLLLAFEAIPFAGFCLSARDGQGYNDPFWRNNQGIAWLASNMPETASLYSNELIAVGYLLDKPGRSLPNSGDKKAMQELCEQLKEQGNGFIIGFKANHWPSLMSHSEIVEMNEQEDMLVIDADFADSTIWRVQ